MFDVINNYSTPTSEHVYPVNSRLAVTHGNPDLRVAILGSAHVIMKALNKGAGCSEPSECRVLLPPGNELEEIKAGIRSCQPRRLPRHSKFCLRCQFKAATSVHAAVASASGAAGSAAPVESEERVDEKEAKEPPSEGHSVWLQSSRSKRAKSRRRQVVVAAAVDSNMIAFRAGHRSDIG